MVAWGNGTHVRDAVRGVGVSHLVPSPDDSPKNCRSTGMKLVFHVRLCIRIVAILSGYSGTAAHGKGRQTSQSSDHGPG